MRWLAGPNSFRSIKTARVQKLQNALHRSCGCSLTCWPDGPISCLCASEATEQLMGRNVKMHSVALGIVAAATIFAATAIAQTRLVTEEMMVKSPDPGIEVYVRNKHPADMTTFRPERTVLYVHGATYPASTAFDLQLGGMSWMDYIAARGYDVYLLDL